jgi:hypothetical protein
MWPIVAHGSALDAWTCPRGEVPGLGLTDEDVDLLRGDECDILGSSEKNSRLSILGLGRFEDG